MERLDGRKLDWHFIECIFYREDWWGTLSEGSRLFRGNDTDPATWEEMPFHGCAYLETESVPAWVEEMWTHPDEIKPGHWLETRWREEWREFHLQLASSPYNKLASFLNRPWEIFDLGNLFRYSLRPMEKLRYHNHTHYEIMLYHPRVLADQWAQPIHRPVERPRSPKIHFIIEDAEEAVAKRRRREWNDL